MLFSNLATLLPLAGAAVAAPSALRFNLKTKESHAVPKGWTEGARAPRGHTVNLQIGLKQGNAAELDKQFWQVSNPKHERYGQYLSASDVARLVAPSQTTLDLVHEWLKAHDVDVSAAKYTASKDWINVALPVEKVEKLLGTKFSQFKHTDGSTLIRAPEWSLPEHLHEHIDVIQPTNSFFRLKSNLVASGFDVAKIEAERAKKPVKGKSVSDVCQSNYVTLECLRTVYNTIDYVPQVPTQNGVAITNYLNETSRRDDTKTFLQKYRPEAVKVASTFPIININNARVDQGPRTAAQLKKGLDGEADLDTETVIGIAYPTNFTAYNTGGQPPFIPDAHEKENGNEPYLEWLNYVSSQDSLPQVISTSYGDDEQTVPYSYAKRTCDQFQQLGARGISIIFSSGDDGVGKDGTCYTNDDSETAAFLPAYPASCPYVTAVGATAQFSPEVAVKRFGSGAGFSNYFAQPSYQSDVVNDYVSSIGDLNDGLYNSSGRAYPDVAAQGNANVIIYNGKTQITGGTSASAPTFGAIIALVNDALIAKGKPVLGFLNPWIYGSAYSTFTDVTSGSSFGCDTDGFPAATGWDAVTGFGTPDFKKLVAAALKK